MGAVGPDADDTVLYRSLSARIGILPDARFWTVSVLSTRFVLLGDVLRFGIR